MRSLTAIAALAVFLIVAEAPLRELLRAGRYRALRANLKPHAPPLNLSRVLEVAGAERCVGDGRCAGDELHDFAAAKGRMARVQAALNSPAKKDAQKYMSSENEVELAVPADATNRPSRNIVGISQLWLFRFCIAVKTHAVNETHAVEGTVLARCLARNRPRDRHAQAPRDRPAPPQSVQQSPSSPPPTAQSSALAPSRRSRAPSPLSSPATPRSQRSPLSRSFSA